MTPLFKYMRKQHARLLLNDGKVRVGTLHEYRDTEAHGCVIGDDTEGTKNLFLDGHGETWTPASIPAFAKTFFELGHESSVTLEGIRLQVPQESPDFYLFCASSEFNEHALREFGYDACVSIDDPQRFFAAISHRLRHKASLEGVFHCQYRDRDAPHDSDDGTHPALIKHPKYKDQHEVRALWRPQKESVRPVIIESRKAMQCCSPWYGL